MKGKLISKNGCVYFHDEQLGKDVIALTPSEAMWFQEFLSTHVSSEFCVQLRLAALAANSDTSKEFPLKRN